MLQPLRLYFSKLGDARYISHLDLYRCFSRAIRQSGLEVWYTEGFNSHMYLTFPLPLSLGFESVCEILELRALEPVDTAELAQRINPHLPAGLEVYNCAEPIKKAKDIAFARYLVAIENGRADAAALERAAEQTLGRREILITKTTKKGQQREVNIRPMIASCKLQSDSAGCLLDLVIAAGSQNSLNPMVFLECLFSGLGAPPAGCSVKRTQVLTADFKNFE